MVLSHFSHKPFRINRKRKYAQIDNFKPTGLWLSDESKKAGQGWKSWCKSESFALHGLKFEAKYECDTSTWVVLNTQKKVLDFSRKYSKRLGSLYSEVQWEEVKKDYGGILISPYHWELRHNREVSWYYGWDVASACVWDLSTIKKRLRK